MLNIECSTEEQIPVAVHLLTAAGMPVPPGGPVTVTVTSGDGTVLQSPAEPTVFRCVSGAAVGVTTYAVSCDGFTDTVNLQVYAPNASAMELEPGPVEMKSAPAVAAAAHERTSWWRRRE